MKSGKRVVVVVVVLERAASVGRPRSEIRLAVKQSRGIGY